MAIGATGNIARVHGMGMLAGNGFGRDHALMAGLVRQPWRRGDVADGPQALDIGAAHFVGLQETALVHGDAQLLEADILRIGDDADGDDHMAEFGGAFLRSEEHTSELQSLMRISYAVFCLKKKNTYS